MVIRRAQLKQAYFTLLGMAGAETRLLRKIRQEDVLTILNLHRVSPEPNPFWNPLHPRLFEDLLVFLKRHFHVTTFARLAVETSDRPEAILSFDDGYDDFVEYAMPLLAKHGLPANQNVIPACVESGQAHWNVRVYDFLNAAPRSLINEIRLEGFGSRLKGEDIDSKAAYGLALSRFLQRRSQHERAPFWGILTAAMERANGVVRGTRMMALDDVRKAAAEHEIGAHSFSHESMAFESDEFFREDLNRCRDFFNERLHLPLTIYAFPNNSYRQSQVEMLEQGGIRHILLVGDRFAVRGQLVSPRFAIYGASRQETRFQALGYKARGLL